MAVEWYVRRGTEQSGPITKQEFEVLQKHLQQSDLVRRSDWLEWRPFQSALVATSDATLVNGEVVECLTPQTLFRTLLERDLRARSIAPERHRQYQYARVVEELMHSVIDEIGSHPHWEEALRDRYREIVSMVEAFIDACNVGFWQRDLRSDARDRLTVLWRHRDLHREFSEAAVRPYLDREELSDIAHDYLRRDARSREFERLLVDALAAAEIYGFNEEIKKQASLVEPHGWSFMSRLSWRRRRVRTLAKSQDLLAKMMAAYATLPDSAVSPPNCKKLFESVAKEGAGWDPLVLEILDTAQRFRGRSAAGSPGGSRMIWCWWRLAHPNLARLYCALRRIETAPWPPAGRGDPDVASDPHMLASIVPEAERGSRNAVSSAEFQQPVSLTVS